MSVYSILSCPGTTKSCEAAEFNDTVRTQCNSPLPAHVQQEHVEARLLLLHQLQDALHTQAVGRAVRVGSVHRHHEAVAVVLVSVAGVVQQT